MAATVLAVWKGPFDAELPNGGVLHPGDTYEISERELESAHWEKSRAKHADHPEKRDS